MRKYIIFMMASSTTPIRSFIELTKQLETKTNLKVYMLCESIADYQKIIREGQFHCDEITFIELGNHKIKDSKHKTGAAIGSSEKSNINKKTWLYKCWRKIYKNSQIAKLLIDIKDIIKIIKINIKKKAEINKYFRHYSPDMVILYGDSRMGYEAHVIHSAAKYKIPRIIAPIVNIAKAEYIVRSGAWCYKKEENEKFSILEKFVLKKYPGSHVKVGDIHAFRYTPCEIAAYGMMNILPNNPWVTGAGMITDIALISQEYYEYAVSVMGESYKRKACVTHTIEESDIKIHLGERDQIQKYIIQKYNIDCSQVVCFALTAYANSSLPLDFETEKEIYTKIAYEMTKIFGKVLISLHPRMDKQKYMYFHEIYGCIIIEEPFYKIIPACDIYIGNSISSTNEIVKNINFPKIFIDHEIYFRGLTDEDIKNIKIEAFKAKEQASLQIIFEDDGKEDFFELLYRKYVRNK